jgi:hypothetical protein
MGPDLDFILNGDIGQPMVGILDFYTWNLTYPRQQAQILFQSLGHKGTLAIWAIVVIVQYMMGSSMVDSLNNVSRAMLICPKQVLAASRQSFFARDGALPFSGWLYRRNRYTRTPINTVAFTSALAICLGLLGEYGDPS